MNTEFALSPTKKNGDHFNIVSYLTKGSNEISLCRNFVSRNTNIAGVTYSTGCIKKNATT